MKSIFSLPGSSPRSDDQLGPTVSKKLIKEKPSDAEKSQELKDSGNGEKVAEGESEQPEDKPEVKLADDQSKEEPPVCDDGKAEAGKESEEVKEIGCHRVRFVGQIERQQQRQRRLRRQRRRRRAPSQSSTFGGVGAN